MTTAIAAIPLIALIALITLTTIITLMAIITLITLVTHPLSLTNSLALLSLTQSHPQAASRLVLVAT